LVDRLADVDDLPAAVRVLTGAVAGADAVVVPDGPWWAQVLAPDRLVAPGMDSAATARILDLELASARYRVSIAHDEPVSTVEWLAAAERAAAALGVAPPDLLMVTGLQARLDDDEPRPVNWWIGDDGRAVVDGSAGGVGRAIAWLAGRWPGRETAVAAALSDPVGLAEQAWD
jgi:hypothetical protein